MQIVSWFSDSVQSKGRKLRTGSSSMATRFQLFIYWHTNYIKIILTVGISNHKDRNEPQLMLIIVLVLNSCHILKYNLFH